MKTRTIITAVIVIALVVCGFLFARSCGLNSRLAKAKADYEEYRRIVQTENELMSTRLDELNSSISDKDQIIGQLEHKVDQYVEKLRHTTQELEELQNAEPVQPELESEPLVINLRAQLSKLTTMFSLSEQTVTLQAEEISALKEKAILLEQVSVEWKSAYEREHQLRLMSEDLFKASERSRKTNKTLTKIAYGVAAGSIVYGLLK